MSKLRSFAGVAGSAAVVMAIVSFGALTLVGVPQLGIHALINPAVSAASKPQKTAAPMPQSGAAPLKANDSQPQYYTVTAFDRGRREGALSYIAARFRTTVERLAAWNHIADPNRIDVGQRLRVA